MTIRITSAVMVRFSDKFRPFELPCCNKPLLEVKVGIAEHNKRNEQKAMSDFITTGRR